jgi:peptidoglycan/xylan/chitin deacetylase (PgdA/CDA1 family)
VLKIKTFLTYLVNKIPSKTLFSFYFKRINKNNIGSVICLHRVIDSKLDEAPSTFNGFIEISDAKLEKLIVELQKLDVDFVSLKTLHNIRNSGRKPAKPLVHFSFDDGYLDNYTIAYPIFKKYHIPFSIFIASDFVSNKNPFMWWWILEDVVKEGLPLAFQKYQFFITKEDYALKSKEAVFEETRTFLLQHIDNDKDYFEEKFKVFARQTQCMVPEIAAWADLKAMALSGLCELGVHTKSHARFANISNAQKCHEIEVCRKQILSETGIASTYFAYPYGSAEDIGSMQGVPEIFAKSGIELALTTIPAELNSDTDPYYIPRIFINNSSTSYSLKSRLNGSYQRELKSRNQH